MKESFSILKSSNRIGMGFTKVKPVKSPERGTSRSAGIDFFVPDDFEAIELYPQQRVLIPSGIKVRVPSGFALIFHNKSGVGSKLGLDRLAEVVDEDYTGEIHLNVVNTGREPVEIVPGMKLLQGLLIPILYSEVVEYPSEEELYDGFDTERGAGGFGSTGV